MNLADKPCYPHTQVFQSDDKQGIVSENGLNFRERLIIALASNPEMFKDDKGNANDFDMVARDIIYQADAIIKLLEEEKK